MENLSGECLCGAVKYECCEPAVLQGHCQCNDCQKISGAGHASNIAVPKGTINLVGELSYHSHTADSGNVVTRGFCPKCGCDMHITNNGVPQFEFIRAGSLHNLELFKPNIAVYTKRAPSWDLLPTNLVHFEEMPEGMVD